MYFLLPTYWASVRLETTRLCILLIVFFCLPVYKYIYIRPHFPSTQWRKFQKIRKSSTKGKEPGGVRASPNRCRTGHEHGCMFLEPLPGGALLWKVGTERLGPRSHGSDSCHCQLGDPERTRKPVTSLSGQVPMDSEHVIVELAPSLSHGLDSPLQMSSVPPLSPWSRLTFAQVLMSFAASVMPG